MSQLTPFEHYMLIKDDCIEFDIENDDHCVDIFNSISESFPEQYDEITDDAINALEQKEYFDSLVSKKPLDQVLCDYQIVAAKTREYLTDVLVEAYYKQEGENERDGSYEAKCARELAL